MNEMLMDEMKPWDIYGIANGEVNTNVREEKKKKIPVNAETAAPWEGAQELTEKKRENWNRWNSVREAFLGKDPIFFIGDKYLHDQIDLAAGRMGETEGMREKKRRALAQYYAMMARTDPGEVYGALDTWMAHYNNDKKTDVDAAFESVRRWYAGQEEDITGSVGAAVLKGAANVEERAVNFARGIYNIFQEANKAKVQSNFMLADQINRDKKPDGAQEERREEIMQSMESAQARINKACADYISEDLAHVRERLQQAEGLPEDWATNSDGFANWVANFGLAVTEFFPDLMAQTATTLIAGPSATGMTYAVNSYYDVEDNHPDMTREQQVVYSIGIGIINTIGEELPYGIMKGKLDKVLLKRGIEKGLMRYLAYMGIAGSFEAADESSQSLAENLTGIITGYFGDTKNWTAKDYRDHIFAGVLESGLTAFGSSALHGNIGWIQNRNKMQVSQRLQGLVDSRLAALDKKSASGQELTPEEETEYQELTALKDAGFDQLYSGASELLRSYINRSIDAMNKRMKASAENAGNAETAGNAAEASGNGSEAGKNDVTVETQNRGENETIETSDETVETTNVTTETENEPKNVTTETNDDVTVDTSQKERDSEEAQAEASSIRIKLRQKFKHNPSDTVEEVKRIGKEYNANIVVVHGFGEHRELLNLIVESKLDAIREEGREPTEEEREDAFAEAESRTDALIAGDGTIYINADVMRPSMVRARLNHEVLVHKGLDDMFRDKKRGVEMRAKLLSAVWEGAFRSQTMDQIIDIYGGIYGVKDKNGHISIDENGKRALAEEWLAKLGETNGVPIMEIFNSHQLEITGWAMEHDIDAMEMRMDPVGITREWMADTGYMPERPGWVKQLFAQIKTYLRQAGLWHGPMSDAEVQALLIRIGKREMQKRGEAENVTEEIPVGDDGEPLTTHEQDLYGLPEERFSIVDEDEQKRLDKEEYIKVYRYMQIGPDGKLHSPMAGIINGKWGSSSEIGKWEMAEEHPEMLEKDKNGQIIITPGEKGEFDHGHFPLAKNEAKTIGASYNPYIHTSNSLLNDQFKEAWNRPELVAVEVLVPKSEMESGYRAKYAKNATGWADWKSGEISDAIAKNGGEARRLFLSRWDKPVRIIPWSEVAQNIKKTIAGTDIQILDSRMPPQLLKDLKKIGVPIKEDGVINHDRLERHMSKSEAKEYLKVTNAKITGNDKTALFTFKRVRNGDIDVSISKSYTIPEDYMKYFEDQNNGKKWHATIDYDAFCDFLDKINLYYTPLTASSIELVRSLREYGEFKNVIKAEKAAERERIRAEKRAAKERLEKDGKAVVLNGSDVRFNLQHDLKGEEREQAIRDTAKITGRSEEDIRKYYDDVTSLISVVLSDMLRYQPMYYAVDPKSGMLWGNSDYDVSIDANNICKKRMLQAYVMNYFLKEHPDFIIDGDSMEDIRKVLIDNGETVSCALCYVEDRRKDLGKIANEFLERMGSGELVNPKKNFAGIVTKRQVDLANDLKEILGDMDLQKARSELSIYDFIAPDGLRALQDKNQKIYEAFIKFNAARGSAAGRLFIGYGEYKHEIMNFTKAKVKKLNDHGGLRIFSFSDFEMHHLFDFIQVIQDCARKGLKMHGYTKVPEFAYLFANTNVKINLSLIALGAGFHTDENGKTVLDFNNTEGIDTKSEMFKLVTSLNSPNIGTILVGISDEHIKAAMKDDFVDYIIPFHSNNPNDLNAYKGIGSWKNYKDYQVDKDAATGSNVTKEKAINIYTDVLSDPTIENEHQFVEKFLDVCHERGIIPRFWNFLKKDENTGRYLYTEGYYKLLIDYKLFDSKTKKILRQNIVQPEFNKDHLQKMLDNYVETAVSDKDMREKAMVYAAKVPEYISRRMNSVVPKEEKKPKASKPKASKPKRISDSLKHGELSTRYSIMPIEALMDKALDGIDWVEDMRKRFDAAKAMLGSNENVYDINKKTGFFWDEFEKRWFVNIPDGEILKSEKELRSMQKTTLGEIYKSDYLYHFIDPDTEIIFEPLPRGTFACFYPKDESIGFDLTKMRTYMKDTRAHYQDLYGAVDKDLFYRLCFRAVLVHEIQHYIQKKYFLSRGGSDPSIKAVRSLIKDFFPDVQDPKTDSYYFYEHIFGEIYARIAEYGSLDAEKLINLDNVDPLDVRINYQGKIENSNIEDTRKRGINLREIYEMRYIANQLTQQGVDYPKVRAVVQKYQQDHHTAIFHSNRGINPVTGENALGKRPKMSNYSKVQFSAEDRKKIDAVLDFVKQHEFGGENSSAWDEGQKVRYSISDEDPQTLSRDGWVNGRLAKRTMRFMEFGVPHHLAEFLAEYDDDELTERPFTNEYFDKMLPLQSPYQDGTNRISDIWKRGSYIMDPNVFDPEIVDIQPGDWALGRWDEAKHKWVIVYVEPPEEKQIDYYDELEKDTEKYLEDKYHFGPGMDNYVIGKSGEVIGRVNEMVPGATENEVYARVTDREGRNVWRFIPLDRLSLFTGDTGVFDIFYNAGKFLLVPRYSLTDEEQNFVDLVKPEVKVGKIDGAALADVIKRKYDIDMTPEDAVRYGKIAQGQRATAARKAAWQEAWDLFSRDNQMFGFIDNFVGGHMQLKPSFRFAGQEFTGSFIDPAWRKYSLKREQGKNESSYHYMKYLEERENALNHGGGQKSDEIAEAFARQMGADTVAVEDEMVEMLRQLKTSDIWEYRRKKKEEDALLDAKLREEAAEVLRAEKKAQIEEEVMNILKDGVDLTEDYLNENPAVFKELHRQIFGREANGLHVGDKMVAAMNAVIRTMHPERVREIGDLYKAGYQAAFEEFRTKLNDLRREYAQGSKDAADLQMKAIDLLNKMLPDGLGMKAFGKQIAELAKIGKEDARREAFDALLKRVLNYAKVENGARLKDELKKRLDQLGRRVDVSLKAVGVRDEDTQVKIDRIREYAAMDGFAVAAELERLQAQSEAQQNAGEDSSETDANIHYLMLFGDFLNKQEPGELNQAIRELNQLARTGKTNIDQMLADRRANDQANLLELEAEVNGGQYLSQPERKDVEDERAGWGFWKKTVNGEFWKSLNLWSKLNLLGNVTREKMNRGNMFYRLEQDTHMAEQQKTTLNTKNQTDLMAEMDALWGFEKGLKGKVARAEKINELREVKENTGIFRFYPISELEGGGKQVKFQRISVDEARQLLKSYDENRKYQNGIGTLKSFQAEAIRHQLQTIDKRVKTQYSAVVDGVTEKLLRAVKAEEKIEAEEAGEKVARKRDYVLIPTPVYSATHQEMKLSQLEALYLLLCWEQPDVRYKMEFNGYTPLTIAQLKAFLDPKVIELGNWMREQLELDREEINKAYMDLYFTKLNEEENYFPTYYGARLNKMTGQQQADLGKADEGGKPTAYSPGALKVRIFHLAEPKIADALILFTNHRHQMNHFVSHARINRELRALFGSPDAMTAIIDVYGVEAYKSLKKSVQDFMNGGDVTMENWASLQKVFGAFVRSKMAFNVTSGMKQMLGVVSFLAEIPAKDLIKGLADGLRHPQEVLKTLGDTEYFRNRWGLGANREMRMLLDKSGNQANKTAIYVQMMDNLGSFPLRFGDAFASLFGGWAVYQYHLKNLLAGGMEKSEAERMAKLEWEMTVERTQQSSAPHMLTETQLGPLRQFFSLFKSNQILMWNEIAPHLYPGKDGWKGMRPGFAALVASSVFMTAFTEMLKHGVKMDKWEWADFAVETLSDLMCGWGPIGSMMSNVLHGLCETFQFKSGPEDDINRALQAVIRMSGDIAEGDERMVYSDIVKILSAAGYFWDPIAPAGAAAREVRKIWNYAESWAGDEDEKPGKLD